MKHKTKLIIILTAEFIAVAILLLLVFMAGKKSYTVTFDLDGGTLLGGETVQRVTQGQSATPPQVVKTGHYLLRWSGTYKEVTSDSTVKAVWEYETSYGIEYDNSQNRNYCEISGCYPEISGSVYIGAYFGDQKVLGVKSGAFSGCDRIEAIYFLDGILKIENEAFKDCSSLAEIALPKTLKVLGNSAFSGCTELSKIILPEGLEEIGDGAFSGCSSLTSITIPSTVKKIGDEAFLGCSSLSEIIFARPQANENQPQESSEGDNSGEELPEENKTPPALYSIGERAFRGCSAISSLVLPEALYSIGAEAFLGCDSLESVTVPRSVTEIGEAAFSINGVTLKLEIEKEEMPATWKQGWCSPTATLIWDAKIALEEEQ